MKKKTNLPDAKLIKYQETIYKNFNDALASKNFLPYKTFMNQFLIENNVNIHNGIFAELIKKRDEYLKTCNEIKFRDFVLTFERDPRFSLEELVPAIVSNTNSRLKTLNMVDNESEHINQALINLNNLLDELLIKKGLNVEIVPNIIICFDKENKLYKIFFNKEALNAH
ncbi:MSC_0623 family F1-like ATPase-associated protein [Mycoplasmopsis adleri]|uniref:MSC_0623 family F1-like ATPase-associated protein n=1 Tax=Mycoplasmopsis adleri TaxID=51362 RepID=UPI003872BD11